MYYVILNQFHFYIRMLARVVSVMSSSPSASCLCIYNTIFLFSNMKANKTRVEYCTIFIQRVHGLPKLV
jgi:hypothetical protein